MRRLLSSLGYVVILLLLAAASRGVWLNRFQPVEGADALDFTHTPPGVLAMVDGAPELPEPGKPLKLNAATEAPRLRFQWFSEPPARYAYISVEAGCEGLKVGPNPWDDGRVIMLWVNLYGKRLSDFLPLWSGRGERKIRSGEMVVPLQRAGGLPCLVIENLGAAGQMTVPALKLMPVAERAWVKPVIATLIVAWLVVLTLAVRSWIARVVWWRALASAAVCVAFCWYGAFPGPWMPLKPILGKFSLNEAVQPPPLQPAPQAPAPEESVPTPAVTDASATAVPESLPAPASEAAAKPEPKPVEIPPFPDSAKGKEKMMAGSLVRQFVANLPGLKIWVHFTVFTGLAVVLATLTGTARAGLLAGALGLLSEFCEWAYGYGVDWGDAGDLAMDAAAILAGLMLWRRTRRIWEKLLLRRKAAAGA